MTNSKPIIGIIAGNGKLPIEIMQNNTARFDFVVVGVLGETNPELYYSLPFKFQSFPIGKVGQIIKFFKDHGVKQVILAGAINRPEFTSLKVDILGMKLLSKILLSKLKGDDQILKIATKFLENQGIEVISYQSLLLSANLSYTSKIQPSSKNIEDIQLGKNLLKDLSFYDIGQSVIVHDGQIMGIEGPEGTNELISRGQKLRKTTKGGILIKAAKIGQDLRFDLPTIGSETILKLHENSYQGLAIQKDFVVILEYEQTMTLIDKHQLFIYFW